jgi:hypothetical protein
VVDVVASDAARKASMLERVIAVIVGIAAAGIVADPVAVMMHVRNIRMSGSVGESSGSAVIVAVGRSRIMMIVAVGRRRTLMIVAVERSRTMAWNETTTNAVRAAPGTARATTTAGVTAAAALAGSRSGPESDSRKRKHRHDDDKSEKPLHPILLCDMRASFEPSETFADVRAARGVPYCCSRRIIGNVVLSESPSHGSAHVC